MNDNLLGFTQYFNTVYFYVSSGVCVLLAVGYLVMVLKQSKRVNPRDFI